MWPGDRPNRLLVEVANAHREAKHLHAKGSSFHRSLDALGTKWWIFFFLLGKSAQGIHLAQLGVPVAAWVCAG